MIASSNGLSLPNFCVGLQLGLYDALSNAAKFAAYMVVGFSPAVTATFPHILCGVVLFDSSESFSDTRQRLFTTVN